MKRTIEALRALVLATAPLAAQTSNNDGTGGQDGTLPATQGDISRLDQLVTLIIACIPVGVDFGGQKNAAQAKSDLAELSKCMVTAGADEPSLKSALTCLNTQMTTAENACTSGTTANASGWEPLGGAPAWAQNSAATPSDAAATDTTGTQPTGDSYTACHKQVFPQSFATCRQQFFTVID